MTEDAADAKKQYTIDFNYIGSYQNFSTGASLTEFEKKQLEHQLEDFRKRGFICDPKVYPSVEVTQSYEAVVGEICDALGLEEPLDEPWSR